MCPLSREAKPFLMKVVFFFSRAFLRYAWQIKVEYICPVYYMMFWYTIKLWNGYCNQHISQVLFYKWWKHLNSTPVADVRCSLSSMIVTVLYARAPTFSHLWLRACILRSVSHLFSYLLASGHHHSKERRKWNGEKTKEGKNERKGEEEQKGGRERKRQEKKGKWASTVHC